MRNRIWTELTKAKFDSEFATLYTVRQRKYLRYANLIILVFSTGGVMGWKIWDGFPAIACIIISIISLFRLILPNIIMTEKQICNLDRIHKFYSDYYNKLEILWYEFEGEKINEEEASRRFYEIKNSESVIDNTVNDNVRSHPKKLMAKAKTHSDQYFKQVFNK